VVVDGRAVHDDLAEFEPDALPTLRAAIDRYAVTFTLDAGPGYVLPRASVRWILVRPEGEFEQLITR
jgi:hypothetical protein